MKTCNFPNKKILTDYFLNRLDPDETAVMQHHLLHCPACRLELEKMRLLADDLAQPEVIEANIYPPVSLVPVWKRSFLRIAAMVGGITLIAFGGYYFSSNRTPDLPININQPPVYQSGDSIDMIRKHALDSIEKVRRDSIEKWGDPMFRRGGVK